MDRTYDIVVRGATVYDGQGGAPFEADVAVKDGRIAAIGPNLAGTGARAPTPGNL